MSEVVIISGKGGTGKTSITAALSTILQEKAVVADCDVDAADLHLILDPKVIIKEKFYSGFLAVIDNQLCNKCDKCRKICRFNGIIIKEGNYVVDSLKCEGCSYCHNICPANAIRMIKKEVGECYISQTRMGSMFSHSKLGIGADNSGKLVARVKINAQKAAEELGLFNILVDGSPGIGCPVISSLSGAKYAVIVTEPTLSGISDMKRVCELAKKFLIPLGCIINKADLSQELTNKIIAYLEDEKIEYLDCLTYDDDFHKAINKGLSLVEYDPEKWQKRFSLIWERIEKCSLN